MSYGTRVVHCVQHRETHSPLRLPEYEHCLSSQLSWKVGIEAKTWHATGTEEMNLGCWEKILSRGKNGFWRLQLTGLIDQKQSVVQTTNTFENKNPKSHNGLYWICNMHELILGKLRDMETLLTLRMGICQARSRLYQLLRVLDGPQIKIEHARPHQEVRGQGGNYCGPWQ